MKAKFSHLDQPASVVELDDLQPGEIGVEVKKFADRETKDADIIELTCEIFFTGEEGNANEQYQGKTFVYPIFFGANAAVTVKILKDVFRKAGFDVASWKADGALPMSTALPGALKLLAAKQLPLIGKIEKRKTKDGERNFFNFTKLLREDPETGETYADALPNPVPNDLVVEAYNAVLEGESVKSVI